MVTHRLAPVFAALLICAAAVSCTTRDGEQPIIERQPALVEISEPTQPEHNAVYNIAVKNIADSGFLIAEVDIPKNAEPIFIGEYPMDNNICIYTVLDGSRVLVGRGIECDVWPPYNEMAVYNFITGEYEETLNGGDLHIWPVYADEKYCVASTSTESMAYTSGTLILFDRSNHTNKIIFEYPTGDGSIPYTGYHPNNIVIWDGQIYFDDFVGEENHPILYAYNIESGALRVVHEYAMNPIVYKDEIWFFVPDENGGFTLLQSESGGEQLKNRHPIGGLVSVQNKLFTTRGMGTDAILGTSGIFEWDSNIAVAEFRRGNVLAGLQANHDFIAWQTSMPHQPPCVYDAADDTLYEFTDYARCEYAFYLNGYAGLIHMVETDGNNARTGNETYLLFQKESSW